MIRLSEGAPWDAGLYPEPARATPWSAPAPARLAFATLWSSGGDPARDGLYRVQALRQVADGRWESLATFCRTAMLGPPFAAESEPVGARLVREFGLHSSDVTDAPEATHALRELCSFLDGCTVITAARRAFLAWLRSSTNTTDARAAWPAAVLDLAEIAGLCLPGRLASEGEGLAASLLGRAPESGPRALEPGHLRAALGVLAARVLSQSEPARAVLVHALGAAARALERGGNARARDAALVLALHEHPSAWRDPGRALEPESYELRDGRLSAAARALPGLFDALAVRRARPAGAARGG